MRISYWLQFHKCFHLLFIRKLILLLLLITINLTDALLISVSLKTPCLSSIDWISSLFYLRRRAITPPMRLAFIAAGLNNSSIRIVTKLGSRISYSVLDSRA